MCISITEADAIRISMHSQWYDTYEAASDAIRFTPITMQCDSIQHNAIRCNTMQLKMYDRLFLWFRQTANHELTYVFSDF